MTTEPDSTQQVRVIRQHRVVERAPRDTVGRLRRALGVAGVYAIGYGNVGSSIYYALGIVAAYALGATPIALALAGIIFIFTAMTYAEGVAMTPTAGGAVSFARRAFNDMVSFVAGWALVLNNVVTTAISAVTAIFYLAHFWPAFKSPATAAAGGMALVGLLMLLNIRGVKETARLNIFFAVIDLGTQLLLVMLGIQLILGGWRDLVGYRLMGPEYWPDSKQIIFAVGVAMVAYVGLDSAAQMAEETKTPTRTLPRAMGWAVITVLFMFTALPVVALCAMPPKELVTVWGNDPVAGIASKLPAVEVHTGVLSGQLSVSALMLPWVAILAFTILVIAANAGILAGSRILYNMAHHKQIFSPLGHISKRFQTPAVAILLVAGVAIGVIAVSMRTQNLLLKLGELYVFISMFAFSLAHLSVWLLRIKEPNTPRPFRAWPTIHIKGKPISVTCTLGFLCCAAIWLWTTLSPEHVFGRYIGILWLVCGMLFYVWYRRRQGLALLEPAVVAEVPPLVTTELAPRRKEMTQEIKRIMIPVHSREYAEEMARIACDLNALYVAHIVAVYAIEVPRTLPVDAELPEQIEEAEAVLEVARHIADTVYDTQIETVILQVRSPGPALVEYAEERDIDLILISVHPDRPGRREEEVFSTTADYVARNAPCWVWTVRRGARRPAETSPDNGGRAAQKGGGR